MTTRGPVHYAAGGGGDGVHCRFCGAKLAPDRVGQDACGALECHDRMIEESGKAILARKRAKHDTISAEVFDRLGDDLVAAEAAARGPSVTWMIPAQNEPLEPLPPERLQRFREHLEVIAEFAFKEPEPDADLTHHEANAPEEEPLVGAACATCQGRCCRDRGGDTALLLPDDFNRYRQRHPGATKQDIIEAYLSHLPELSTRDGCVYQAMTGCALPREMRQDICNSYYCDALRWLRTDFSEKGAEAAVLVAAHKGAPERIAVMQPDGRRELVVDLTEDKS